MKNNLKKMIKLFDPYYGKEEKDAILKVLKSGYWASGSGGTTASLPAVISVCAPVSSGWIWNGGV